MGYSCYEMNGRDQGYGVPATCDHPGCNKNIDRGMAYACGGDPTENCGLFFCGEHRSHCVDPDAEWTSENRHTFGVCERCAADAEPFDPSPDSQEWIDHKLTNPTWAEWRAENPKWVAENHPGDTQ